MSTHTSDPQAGNHPSGTKPSSVLSRIGDIDVDTFMQTDWHRNARLFRQAIPDFQALCKIDELRALALNPDAEVRLIEQSGDNWSLTQGPLSQLPSQDAPQWTVLIQGLNLLLDPAARLLERFRFVPDARLDDLMVSIASDGGGVGPHFDSYDVFLLQMHGQRRWRIGVQSDLSLRDDVPLKILRNFEPEQEFILNPGDMLYLPPRYAHDGIAIGDCTTLSIGFRSPTAAELMSSVLRQMADDMVCDDTHGALRFADPQRGATRLPAQLPDDLVKWVTQYVQNMRPSARTIEKGLLAERTEPKYSVMFAAPARAPTPKSTWRILSTRGIRLHRASRLMYGDTAFAINGESFDLLGDDISMQVLRHLADHRSLAPSDCGTLRPDSAFIPWCTEMLDAGWIEIRSDQS